MTNEPSRRDRSLPLPVVYLTALVLLIIGVGLLYYGINDGILHQDLTARDKAGRIGYFKAIPAVVFGIAFALLGAGFSFAAVFLVKNEREQRIIKGQS